MKFEIEITNEEIKEYCQEAIMRKLFSETTHYETRIMNNCIKEATREVIKNNMEKVLNGAMKYGGNYIGKKGVKKMLEEMIDD